MEGATNDEIKKELEKFKKEMEVAKDIAELKKEVALHKTYFRFSVGFVAFIATVLGLFGVHGWDDLITKINSAYEGKLTEINSTYEDKFSEIQDRYTNMAMAFSLADSGRSKEALPYLIVLYEFNHYDEPILRTFLDALDDIGDCEQSLQYLNEVRADEKSFKNIQDPMIFFTAGSILINCNQDNTTTEEARMMFERSLKNCDVTESRRRFPMYGLFAYYFTKHDLQKAEHYLQEASTIISNYPPYVLPVEEEWFKILLKQNDPFVSELKPLWNRIVTNKLFHPTKDRLF